MGYEGPDFATGSFPGEETYRRITRGECVAPDAQGLDQLLNLGFVEPAHHPGTYQPVDLRQAQDEILARARHDLAALAMAASLTPAPDKEAAGLGPEYLDGREAINERIGRETAGAWSEILCAQPHVPDPTAQRRAHARDIATLERGVRMRTLYPAPARGRSSSRDWVREMSAHGGEYRVMTSPFNRGIIIDRRIAFIDDLATPGIDRLTRCVVVRDLATVAFLASIFEAAWERALGWTCRPDNQTVTTRTQRALLRLLIHDRTQETAAKELDMSVGAAEKQLGALRKALGVNSTYAAIAWFLRSDEAEIE